MCQITEGNIDQLIVDILVLGITTGKSIRCMLFCSHHSSFSVVSLHTRGVTCNSLQSGECSHHTRCLGDIVIRHYGSCSYPLGILNNSFPLPSSIQNWIQPTEFSHVGARGRSFVYSGLYPVPTLSPTVLPITSPAAQLGLNPLLAL